MKAIKKILFYADEGAPNEIALGRAVRYAESLKASITLVAVVKPARSQVLLTAADKDLRGYLEEAERLMVAKRKDELEALAKTIPNQGLQSSVKVLVGDPVESIIRHVIQGGYDVLTKAPSPAHGLRRQLFGSIDMRLLRACPCVVAIIRTDRPQIHGRVALAIDYAPSNDLKAKLNESIFQLATQVKASFDLKELYLLHAWSVYENIALSHARGVSPAKALGELKNAEQDRRKQWLSSLVKDVQQSLDGLEIEALYGEPADAISKRLADIDADFVVIGTTSRTGVSGLLIGNTAEEILSRVDCSVVTVKPEGFVSPVSSR